MTDNTPAQIKIVPPVMELDSDAWAEQEDSDIEAEEEEQIIIEAFDPNLIKVDTRPMTIDLVLSRIAHEELDLAPDFQRQAGIWTTSAKSRLIESILIRIPLPAFYMDATEEDRWLVIDGLQRLTALKEFVQDKDLTLKGLEFLPQLENKSYDELPRNFQRRILESLLTVYVIEKGTPPEVKFTIFRRINRGGLPLSPQELRHALNPGKAPKVLASLADSEEFKEATGIRDWRKKRMVDREFVLRFLAFNITNYQDYSSKSLDVFLNDAMVEINKMPEADLALLESKFIKAMAGANEIFAKFAFRKRDKEDLEKKYSINKALFEAWSVSLGNLTEEEIKILTERKDVLSDRFIDLMADDDDFQASISHGTSTGGKVKYRFKRIEKLIQNVLSEAVPPPSFS
ncbi:MAG: DUF262 domain-containing protein [Cyanobacteriota bacterium]|nr:DUF262 domain-containing protein [Cyanobacteriota bacterium]